MTSDHIDFTKMPDVEKVARIRRSLFDLLDPKQAFTVADEAAFHLQILMLDHVSDYISPNCKGIDKSSDAVFQRKQSIWHTLWLSAHLIKSPAAINPGYKADLDPPEDNAPMYQLASGYLSSIADTIEENLSKKLKGKLGAENTEELQRSRIEKFRLLARNLMSGFDAPQQERLANTRYHAADCCVVLIRPGFVFPIPLYVLIKERDGKCRWFYNYENTYDFGMPYRDFIFDWSIFPENIFA